MRKISEEDKQKIEENARRFVESMHPILSFIATIVALGVVIGIGWLMSECAFMLYDMAKRVIASSILTARDIWALSLSMVVILFWFIYLARKNRLLSEQNKLLHEISGKHGEFVDCTVDLVNKITSTFDKMSDMCDRKAKEAETPTENSDATPHKSDGAAEA